MATYKIQLKNVEGIMEDIELEGGTVETPTIEISGITQELLTNGSKMGTFTEEQAAQIIKAKGFIVSDTAVGQNYYFKIQLSASGGGYMFSCESNTDVNSNDLILCAVNGTNWVAVIQLGKRFTEAIYNELKASETDWQPINFYYANLSWEEFDVYGLEITDENYQQFLKNKKAPIEINNVLFDVSSFYDEDDGCYSVYYSSVVNNHINKINILWYPNGSSVDDCESSVIDESALIEAIQLEGTISGWETENFILMNVLFEPTDYQKFLQNKTAPIMIEGKIFQLVNSNFEDETQGYYNTYTQITNNYIYTIVIGWFDDEQWVDEAYNNKISSSGGTSKVVVRMSAVENDNGSLDSIMSAEEISVFESTPENVEFLIEDSDWGYTFHLTYAFRMDDGTFRYMVNDTDGWFIYLDIMDGYFSYHYFKPNSSGGSSGETSEIPTIMIRDFQSYENIYGTLEGVDWEGIKKAKMCFVNQEEKEEGNGMIFQVVSINDDNISLSFVATADDGITTSYYIYLYKNGNEVSFDCYKNTSNKVIYDSSSTDYYEVETLDDRIQINLLYENRYYNLDLAEINLGEYDQGIPLYINIPYNTKAFIYASNDINVGSLGFIAPNKIFETLIHGLEVNAKGSYTHMESYVEYIQENGDNFSLMAFYAETDEIGVCKINGTYKNDEL